MASKKRVFVNGDNGLKEQVAPVETPVAQTPAPATKPAEEKVALLTKEAHAERRELLGAAKANGTFGKAIQVLSWEALHNAFDGKEPVSADALTAYFEAEVPKKVSRGHQFTQEAQYIVIGGLLKAVEKGSDAAAETLAYLRGRIFNGCVSVPLEMVLLALYVRHQADDEKEGQLDLDSDGAPVVLVCGCGACGGRKFIRETWMTGNGSRVGNYVEGKSLKGAAEPFVPVARKCQGTINKSVWEANAPIKAENAKIAERRAKKEQTEAFHALKPMIYGLTSREVAKIVGGEQKRQERRQQSADRISEIVEGLKPKTKVVGAAYPTTRRGERGDARQSRF